MNDDWPELAELVTNCEATAGEGWRHSSEMRSQAVALIAQVQALEQQFEGLQVHAHLRRLNEQLLAGLGSVEMVEGGMGIERMVALVWPADIHPQPAEDAVAQHGLYRIEVWLGPGLQDGRARIRIAGMKRLEAVLPTSAERFRTALLSVFQNPLFVPRPTDEEKTSEEQQSDEVSNAEDEAT